MVYKVDGNPQLDSRHWSMYSNILKSNEFQNIHKGSHTTETISIFDVSILSSKCWPHLSYLRRSEKVFTSFSKRLNLDLKISGLFLLQLIWFKSAGSFLEFYTVRTRSLFDVFFRGYIAEVEG